MQTKIRNVAMTGVLAAVGVIGGTFSIPMGVAKCAPVQHLINVICAVVLGPAYGVACAFLTSLVRNLLGTGTPLAFLGSMVGALLAGLAYRKSQKILFAMAGEVIGTGLIGAMLCYPVARFLMGNSSAALFTFVVPFGISTLVGSLIAGFLLFALKKTHVLERLASPLNR